MGKGEERGEKRQRQRQRERERIYSENIMSNDLTIQSHRKKERVRE